MSKYGLVIRNGDVVDGSGDPVRETDVAVAAGVIREVGEVTGDGARVMNDE